MGDTNTARKGYLYCKYVCHCCGLCQSKADGKLSNTEYGGGYCFPWFNGDNFYLECGGFEGKREGQDDEDY